MRELRGVDLNYMSGGTGDAADVAMGAINGGAAGAAISILRTDTIWRLLRMREMKIMEVESVSGG